MGRFVKVFWILGVTLLSLLIILSIVFEKYPYKEDNITAIIWLLVSVVPPTLLHIIPNVLTDKVNNTPPKQFLKYILIVEIVTLLVFFSNVLYLSRSSEINVSMYYINSYKITLLFTFLLSGSLALYYFRKPKEIILINSSEIQRKVAHFIKKNEIERLLEFLLDKNHNFDENKYNEFLMMSQQWREIEKQNNLNITDIDSIKVTKNKIVNSILEFTKDL
jgi:Effector-associated domain 11